MSEYYFNDVRNDYCPSIHHNSAAFNYYYGLKSIFPAHKQCFYIDSVASARVWINKSLPSVPNSYRSIFVCRHFQSTPPSLAWCLLPPPLLLFLPRLIDTLYITVVHVLSIPLNLFDASIFFLHFSLFINSLNFLREL